MGGEWNLEKSHLYFSEQQQAVSTRQFCFLPNPWGNWWWLQNSRKVPGDELIKKDQESWREKVWDCVSFTCSWLTDNKGSSNWDSELFWESRNSENFLDWHRQRSPYPVPRSKGRGCLGKQETWVTRVNRTMSPGVQGHTCPPILPALTLSSMTRADLTDDNVVIRLAKYQIHPICQAEAKWLITSSQTLIIPFLHRGKLS